MMNMKVMVNHVSIFVDANFGQYRSCVMDSAKSKE